MDSGRCVGDRPAHMGDSVMVYYNAVWADATLWTLPIIAAMVAVYLFVDWKLK